MTTPGEDPTQAQVDESPVDESPAVADDAVADDALGAARVALAAVENLPLERHPEAFGHFDELLRAALEAPPHVASG